MSKIAFSNLCLYGLGLGNCESLCLRKSEVCKLGTSVLILGTFSRGSILNCDSLCTCESCFCLASFNCFGSLFSAYGISVCNSDFCHMTFSRLNRRLGALCRRVCQSYRMYDNRFLGFLCGILGNCAGNYYLKVMVLDNSWHVGVVIFIGIVLCRSVFYIIIINRCDFGLCLCGRSLLFYYLFCFFFREFLVIYGYRLIICGSSCFGVVYRLFLVSNDRSCLCCGSNFFLGFCYGSLFLCRSGCYWSSFFLGFCYGLAHGSFVCH